MIFNVNAFDISLLSLVWPLIFVITSIPIGFFIDKNGFKMSVGIGAILLAVFSIIRIFSVYPNYNFIILLIAQSGAALSQPFIFSSITKLSISWFPEDEQGLATGLGTIGLFIGMMLALILTPILFLTYGINGMLIIYAIISCISASLFIILAKERVIIYSEEVISTFTLKDLWNLSKLKDFLILEYGFFAGVGGFTALMTWLEEILHSLHNISIDKAGFAGGILIIGGIIGAIVIPSISDKIGKIKYFVLADIGIGAVMLHVIEFTSNLFLIVITCFIIGFFLMSSLPPRPRIIK
ncbi:MAG TPA: MFS transporter [Thermoplasmatales archaeon]|nr:MFS transporter [Thermoplasmatales archaeon]